MPRLPSTAPALAPFAAADYPEFPYPGSRPGCSFVHLGGTCYPLLPDVTMPSGWRVVAGDESESCLDAWLAHHGAEPLGSRYPVLAYGSNACPEKINWLRSDLGLTGPAVVMRASCTGVVAAWSAGHRPRDGQRPAVLVAAPGASEHHAVWFATPDQRRVLDRCEGRGSRYRLVRLADGVATIRLDDGTEPRHMLAYTAASNEMNPLLVDGYPVRCAELDQRSALALRGTPARSDGLRCTEITGEP
ncbi:gamma-glutamylcyclotransferase family protein [Haloechinothrix sp. LS1_15]|uniref:gamma-glutamylcyclotransferase family protein n=1 Tax=Haloechinothrix sp. LS1_15 TaxID=2652248 RepID=UPI002946FA7B|nr:gamma-glutamylcyclotransferase family protein [Haloechinothrix sp. LS1_15]MDV6012322.1 gamma-glutamylcyclotransferase [Haloechinothrix sp. LS1_15]